MSDVVYTYVPTTGSVLTSAGMNANLYHTTATRSIMETSNGHLDYLNFNPVFQVRSYHVRPGQAGVAESVGRTPSNDYFSDLWTGLGNGYLPVAGCCVTFFTEYDISLAAFFASGFCTVWRQFGADSGAWPARAAAPDISVRTFFASNGGPVVTHQHSQRDLPQTVFLRNPGAVATQGNISTVEQRLTRHFNLSHTKMVGGTTPCDQLLAGEHTFGLAVLVKKNLAGQDTSNADESWDLRLNGVVGADGRPVSNYAGVHRCRLYVRNVTACRLL